MSLVRAGSIARFPAEFQLMMAANPCPCGNLGRKGKACLCSIQELQRYRRKLGGPLLDRIDIRVPVEPTPPELLLGPAGESSAIVRARVDAAMRIQADRYRGVGRFSRTDRVMAPLNARLGPGRVERYCRLESEAARAFRYRRAKAIPFFEGMPLDPQSSPHYSGPRRAERHRRGADNRSCTASALRRWRRGLARRLKNGFNRTAGRRITGRLTRFTASYINAFAVERPAACVENGREKECGA